MADEDIEPVYGRRDSLFRCAADSVPGMATIGERVRARRGALDLTQEELPGEVEVTPQHISRIESGLNSPSLELLVRLSRTLGTSADFLLTGEEEPALDVVAAIRAAPQLDSQAKRLLVDLFARLSA